MEAWCNIEYHSLAHLFGMGLSTVCVAGRCVHSHCGQSIEMVYKDTHWQQCSGSSRWLLLYLGLSTVFRGN